MAKPSERSLKRHGFSLKAGNGFFATAAWIDIRE